MAGILTRVTGLSADQIAQLQQVQSQIQRLLGSTKVNVDAVIAGAASDNPFAEFLSSLPRLVEKARQIPGIGDLVRETGDLANRLPARRLADLTQVSQSIDRALELFGPLKDSLLSGKFEANIQGLLEKSLELPENLVRQQGAIGAVAEEIKKFFRLFRLMVGWRGAAPDPNEIVEVLGNALVGADPSLLSRPREALQAALAPLRDLVPSGPLTGAWQSAPAEFQAFWQDIDARVSAGAVIDWQRLEADLQAQQRRMLEIAALRDRLFAECLGNVNRLQLPRLSAVTAAIAAVPKIQPTQMTPIIKGLRRQLQGMIHTLSSWNPDQDELRRTARAIADYYLGDIEKTSLGYLRTQFIVFEQGLEHKIESLPFRDIAREVETALRRLAKRIDVLDPDKFRQSVRKFFAELGAEITGTPRDAIRNSVGEVWQEVEEALREVSNHVQTLRTTLEIAVSSVKSFTSEVQPALSQISETSSKINAQLAAFDLNAPADEVVARLQQIRDIVRAVDVSLLPAAAVSALREGANALREIDITGSVSRPLDDILAALDPTPIITPVSASLSALVRELKSIDPSGLSTELDGSVDEVLKALNQFDPQRLRSTLQEELAPLRGALQGIDFQAIFAPLERLHAELAAKVDAFLDPDVIFTPLEKLYQPVIDIIDAADIARLVTLVEGRAEELGAKVGAIAGPPSVLANETGALKSSLASGVNTENELVGFRPGDLLIPLIDLHRKLMEAVDGLADEILEPAAAQLRRVLNGSLEALHPNNVASEVSSALAGVKAKFDLPTLSAKFRDAALRYNGATVKIANAARLNLSPADQASAGRIRVMLPNLDPLRLLPSAAQAEALGASSVRAKARLDLGGLRISFAATAPRLNAILPAFLSAPGFGASELRQALRALDPTPFRDEINALFDEFGAKLAGVQGQLGTVLEELAAAAEKFLLPVTPGRLISLAQHLQFALKQQIAALGPATYRDEVKLLFDVVKRQLTVLDPSVLRDELVAIRDEVIQSINGLVDEILPDPAPFIELESQLAGLKPGRALAELRSELEPLSKILATIDPDSLFDPIVEAIARVRGQIPDVLAKIEGALDEVLNALSAGGIESVSVSGQISAA